MNLEKFEERVSAFALEQGWVPLLNATNGEHSFFAVRVFSQYKDKVVDFSTTAENVTFNCSFRGAKLEELLDNLYKVIKQLKTFDIKEVK